MWRYLEVELEQATNPSSPTVMLDNPHTRPETKYGHELLDGDFLRAGVHHRRILNGLRLERRRVISST